MNSMPWQSATVVNQKTIHSMGDPCYGHVESSARTVGEEFAAHGKSFI
jgi:hypothetical protein